jgi:hypothetical protein
VPGAPYGDIPSADLVAGYGPAGAFPLFIRPYLAVLIPTTSVVGDAGRIFVEIKGISGTPISLQTITTASSVDVTITTVICSNSVGTDTICLTAMYTVTGPAPEVHFGCGIGTNSATILTRTTAVLHTEDEPTWP